MITVRKLTVVAGALAAAALTASAAQAQLVGNSDQPIDIAGNHWELFDDQRLQVWDGAVEVVQGVNRLRAEQLRIYHAAKPGAKKGDRGQWGEPQRMIAKGQVYFITPETTAKGNDAVYDLIKDEVTMTGDVVLTRGPSVVRGDKLVLNVTTGLATLDSAAQGRGTKRVRGVFYPDQAPAAGAAPARPAASPARSAAAAPGGTRATSGSTTPAPPPR